jgi:hypothetical protein
MTEFIWTTSRILASIVDDDRSSLALTYTAPHSYRTLKRRERERENGKKKNLKRQKNYIIF